MLLHNDNNNYFQKAFWQLKYLTVIPVEIPSTQIRSYTLYETQ